MSKQDRNKSYYEANRERILEKAKQRYSENAALKSFAQWEEHNKNVMAAGNRAAFDRITTETVNKLGLNRVDFVKGYSQFLFSGILKEQQTMPELYQNKVLWALFMRFLAKLETFQDERVKKTLDRYITDLGLTTKERIAKSQAAIDSYKK
ncbi:hypothetical protein NXY55_10130 [Aeromonas veronii]|nr:hypothetical protein [Aeromonas veronii]